MSHHNIHQVHPALSISIDSMIPKNTSRRKKPKKNTNLNTTMGILLSKPKEKQQKREGLMAQMKNKTEVKHKENLKSH